MGDECRFVRDEKREMNSKASLFFCCTVNVLVHIHDRGFSVSKISFRQRSIVWFLLFRFCCFIFPRYKNGYVWSGLLTEQYMYVYVFRYFFINGVEHIVLMEGDNVVPSLCRE